MLTSDVENFPGYPTGIGGPEMMIHMREQAERFGLEVHDKNVEKVGSERKRYLDLRYLRRGLLPRTRGDCGRRWRFGDGGSYIPHQIRQ